MKEYIVPYTYQIFGKAKVLASSEEEALQLAQDLPCPEPADLTSTEDPQIKSAEFSYVNSSFEVYEDDFELYNQ
jgi:hypothetical protein